MKKFIFFFLSFFFFSGMFAKNETKEKPKFFQTFLNRISQSVSQNSKFQDLLTTYKDYESNIKFIAYGTLICNTSIFLAFLGNSLAILFDKNEISKGSVFLGTVGSGIGIGFTVKGIYGLYEKKKLSNIDRN